MHRHILFIATIIFIVWGTVTPAHAEIITVTSCDFASLQQAVATDVVGKIILFDCEGTIVFTEPVVISQDVTIVGGGDIIFDGGGTSRLFVVNGSQSLVLDGLTIQNGYSTNISIITINRDSHLSILNSTFLNHSTTDSGGAIFNFWSSVTIHNSTFSGCTCVDGAIRNQGHVTITDSTFSDNRHGAIVNDYAWGRMTISDSTFTNNSADEGGGAIHNGGYMEITTSTFTDNSADEGGGAIYNGGWLSVTDSTFINNSAPNGGAISSHGRIAYGDALTITNTAFRGNSADERGGALYHTGDSVTITGSTFADNVATIGQSAIFSDGTIISESSHYENNTCGGYGVFTSVYDKNTAENATGCPPDVVRIGTTVTDCENFTGDGTISQAVQTANYSHDPITFTCSGTIVFTETLFISGHVTIIGGGDIVFDGGGTQGFFGVGDSPQEFPPPNSELSPASLLLDGLTLQNGVSPIRNAQYGTLTMNNITFTGNAEGISNSGSIIISNSTFSDNGGYHATIFNYGRVIITNSTFSDNTTLSNDSGEAIMNHRWMSIQNSHFENNACGGTGIFINNGGNTSQNADGCPSDSPPTTVVSDCVNFKGAGTLYEALRVANATSEPITFTCEGVINFTETIVIHKAVTINGGGNITFDGGGVQSFFTLYDGASLTLNDLTVQNGGTSGNNRGVIDISSHTSTLVINNSTIRGHTMDYQVILNTGNLTINNSTFIDNSSRIIFNAGTLTITNSTFSENEEVNVLTNIQESTATISDSSFSYNSGGLQGAIVFNVGNLTISNSTFSDNLATYNAGAINNSGMLFITDSTFTGNSAISTNDNYTKAGAISNDGTLFITNSAFADNTSQHCGAIYNYDALTISNSTFTNNSATQDGGAICNINRLTITNSTFTGNSAIMGGAISNESILNYGTSRLTITASTLSDNVATTGSAIFSDADATILSQDTHYANNDCVVEGIFTDGGGNTADNADGCLYQP
jgi:predicted outer membrane repeat protein